MPVYEISFIPFILYRIVSYHLKRFTISNHQVLVSFYIVHPLIL